MTQEELFTILKEKFRKIAEENHLLDEDVEIACRALTPHEAIGDTKRKDYPILDGAEVMLQADFQGGIGQAFTETPASFSGTLREVLELEIIHNAYDRSLFVATLNAVMRKLGLCDRSIHCRNKGPEDCACKVVEKIKETYGQVKITQIGFQPAMFAKIAENFPMKILDLNPKNIGRVVHGVQIQDGIKDYQEAVDWADLILCTGSTLVNGSMVNFLDLDKEVLFYGTSCAGAAPLLGLKRMCHAD